MAKKTGVMKKPSGMRKRPATEQEPVACSALHKQRVVEMLLQHGQTYSSVWATSGHLSAAKS